MNLATNATFDMEKSIHSICSTISNGSFLYAPGKGFAKGDKNLLGKTKPKRLKQNINMKEDSSPINRTTRFQSYTTDRLEAENSFLSGELLLHAEEEEDRFQHQSRNGSASRAIPTLSFASKPGSSRFRVSKQTRLSSPVIKMDNESSKVVTILPENKPIPFIVTEVSDTSSKPRKLRLPAVKFKHVVTDKNNILAFKQKALFENCKKSNKVVRNHSYNKHNKHSEAINAILSPRYDRHPFASAASGNYEITGDAEGDDFASIFSNSTVLTPPAPARPTQFGYRENVFAVKYTPPKHDIFTPAGLLFPDDTKKYASSKPVASGKTAFYREQRPFVENEDEGENECECVGYTAPIIVPGSGIPAQNLNSGEHGLLLDLTIGEHAFDDNENYEDESETAAGSTGPTSAGAAGMSSDNQLNLASKSFLNGGANAAEIEAEIEMSVLSDLGDLGGDDNALALALDRGLGGSGLDVDEDEGGGDLSMISRSELSGAQESSVCPCTGEAAAAAIAACFVPHKAPLAPALQAQLQMKMQMKMQMEMQKIQMNTHISVRVQMDPTPAMEYRPPAGSTGPEFGYGTYQPGTSVELDPRLMHENARKLELEALRNKPERRIKKGTTGKGVYHWESARPTKDHHKPALRKKLVSVVPPPFSLDTAIDVITYGSSNSSPTATTTTTTAAAATNYWDHEKCSKIVQEERTCPVYRHHRTEGVLNPEGFHFAEVSCPETVTDAPSCCGINGVDGSSSSSDVNRMNVSSSRPVTVVKGKSGTGTSKAKTPITGVEIRRTPGTSFFAQMSSRTGLRADIVGSGVLANTNSGAEGLRGPDAARAPEMFRFDSMQQSAEGVAGSHRCESLTLPMAVVNLNNSVPLSLSLSQSQSLADPESGIIAPAQGLDGGTSLASSTLRAAGAATGGVDSSDVVESCFSVTSPSSVIESSSSCCSVAPLVDTLPAHYIPISTVPLVAALSPNKTHRKLAARSASSSSSVSLGSAAAPDCEALSYILGTATVNTSSATTTTAATVNSTGCGSKKSFPRVANSSIRERGGPNVPEKNRFSIHWSPDTNSKSQQGVIKDAGGAILHDPGLPGNKLTAVRSNADSPHKFNGSSPLKPRPPAALGNTNSNSNSNANANTSTGFSTVTTVTMEPTVDVFQGMRFKVPTSPSQPHPHQRYQFQQQLQQQKPQSRSSPTQVPTLVVPAPIELTTTAVTATSVGFEGSSPTFIPIAVKLSPTHRTRKQHMPSAASTTISDIGGTKSGAVVIPSFVTLTLDPESRPTSKAKASSPHALSSLSRPRPVSTTIRPLTRPMTDNMTDIETPSSRHPAITTELLTETDVTALEGFRDSPIPVENFIEVPETLAL